jgi:hypothetical protein
MSACGQAGGDQSNAGGVTADEAAQLNKAAAQQDQTRPPPRVTQGDLPKPPLPPEDPE